MSGCLSPPAGTAFVFGFLHVSGMFPLTKLAEMQYKTSLHFSERTAKMGCRSFDATARRAGVSALAAFRCVPAVVCRRRECGDALW